MSHNENYALTRFTFSLKEAQIITGVTTRKMYSLIEHELIIPTKSTRKGGTKYLLTYSDLLDILISEFLFQKFPIYLVKEMLEKIKNNVYKTDIVTHKVPTIPFPFIGDELNIKAKCIERLKRNLNDSIKKFLSEKGETYEKST